MSWKVQNKMSLRQQFIDGASLAGANVRALCRHFSISPTTGYKWLKRHRELGSDGLKDQSRRPASSPRRVADRVERAVMALRAQHPAWGARKLREILKADAFEPVPARSTIHSILKRRGLIDYQRPQRDLLRFERPEPNDLWQMDFKGHFPTDEGPCHPFTCLDDHSRFSLGIFSCAREDAVSVRPKLEALFGTYGLPKAILCDNGSPWGNPSDRCPVTQLGVWLWRLGIDVLHGRPYHPQTQGKLERFHRSFKAEVLTRPAWKNHDQCQSAFDHWRPIYNHRRPHEALNDEVPAKHYRASTRSMPASLPPVDYEEGTITRRVCVSGTLSYNNTFYYVGRAFRGFDIGLLATNEDGVHDVHFGWKKLGQIDRKTAPVGKAKTKSTSIWPPR